MAMQSSSSSFSYRFTYDVFLSFRGEDTHHSFTGNLYKALHDKGIYTLIDDQDLCRGNQITSALEKAIQESKIFIIVLSENYASSSFCLNELAYILNFIKGNGLLVLPLFYIVDPSHVQHQRCSFGETWANHEKKFKHNNIKINRVPLLATNYPVVGLESQVIKVKKLLDVGSDDVVHMVGIHKLGGIGKMTLAVAVYNFVAIYNSIADHFEGLCFLENLLIHHGVKRTYEVKELNKEDALQLFSWKAFKSKKIDWHYEDVLNRVVTYAFGLPLALERYYDALEEDEQGVFLHISCCFKEYNLVDVQDILHAHHGNCMKYHIGLLVKKFLIKINRNGKVTLHNLIEDMGKEIVRKESPKEPKKCSRLGLGTSRIEIIFMNFPLFKEREVEWDGDAFKRMKNLKTLIIKNGLFSKGPKHLPNTLRVLEW
ncbi:hypothetical protein GYH30_004555 [Glycine max]|uniref:TIR domain-containing protein n=1 Tax=Glycine max TaxID=3847 RepID=K7K9I6_SOYBN|nr:hypothetical protein GYH30_004555 [Glycine max]